MESAWLCPFASSGYPDAAVGSQSGGFECAPVLAHRVRPRHQLQRDVIDERIRLGCGCLITFTHGGSDS